MNDKTIELISQRVAEYKKNIDKSVNNTRDVDSHISALSEVFNLDEREVESIANDVLIKQEQQISVKDKIYDGLIKYGKEVIIACITVTIVSFFIFGRSTVQPNPQGQITVNENQPVIALYTKKAKIAQAMSNIMPIKMAVLEYYMDTGDFPKSLSDIGIEKAHLMNSKVIEAIKLGNDGGIIAKLKDSVAKDLLIKITPTSAMGGSLIEWECQTNFSGYFGSCAKASLKKHLKRFK